MGRGGGTYNELGGSTSPFPYMLQQTRKNFSGYVFSSIWRLTLFFSWGWFGWVNLQYISILSRARSRNFLSQGMLQKHGFFFQRDTQSGSYVGSTTYMSRFFFIFKSFIGVCASNTVFVSRQVGMYDGTIAIYNVRSRSDTPALDSL